MPPRTKSDPLGDLLASASKNFGLTVGPLGTIAEDAVFISTGNVAADYALGGGIPLGRSIELFGPSGCGKSTLVSQAAANLQKIIKAGGDKSKGISANDVIIFLDYENAVDIDYMKALGIDVEHPSFQFAQPDTLEQGADFIRKAVPTGRVRLIIIDSVAAMVPSAQAEAESIAKSLPALTARLMKSFGQSMNPILRQHNASMVFINHETQVMAMGGPPSYGPPPTTTPGGSALKYFASVRVQFRPIKQHKGEYVDPATKVKSEIPTMVDVKIKPIKNRLAPPFREAVIRVRFGKGFDPLWTAMQILQSNKYVVKETGGRFFFHKTIDAVPADWMQREASDKHRPYIHGEKNIFTYGDLHPEWAEALISFSAKVLAENIDTLGKIVPVTEEDIEPEEDEEMADFDAILAETANQPNRVQI